MWTASILSVRLLLTVFFILGYSLLASGQDATCSPTTSCSSGCCSTSYSCGFGPAYCGEGNCTGTCDAVAECGTYAAADDYDCPLQVCCSQYGFCGTTSAFCGTGCITGCDPVVEPSCSGSSSDQKTIGYYESWSYTRACDAWSPSNINPLLWTHLNYGFALIGDDYTISQMNDFDTELYPLFTGLKQLNGALKTYISVGGWAAGGAIFSDMVSTAENRATFISSAVQFMRTYSIDGIDIDWEYPAASDRDGVAADTENFVTFLQELKAACGSIYGITATLPSSYWYMQGFDIVGMEPYVDWFNFMSYDIHGTWDGDNPSTQAVVQPHTNLTEITEGLDLLWRNGISPSKVVMGLAFYGRSFTLADPDCNTPLCAFSGGGDPGPCTATSGILSNAEIQNIIAEYDLTPILNEEAAVKYMTWNSDQWVSYDDSETLELKKTFANSHCLGGTMVWALDLDNVTTSTSVANLKTTGLKLIGDDVDSNPDFALQKLAAISQQNSINLISYWTDCSASPSCAPGFTLATLGHGKVFDADLMAYTGDGCHGGGNGYNRALCVEADVQLKDCSWFGKPKDCKQTCPAGYVLLGQNTHIGGASTSCKSGHFSSYCCGSVVASNGVGECLDEILADWMSGGSPTLTDEDMEAIIKFEDDPAIGTLEECESLVEGLGNLVDPADYILNDIAGAWQTYRGVGYAVWSPAINSNYPTSSSVSCTTTITSTITTATTTSKARTVTCNGSKYTQPCAHYSSVNAVNPSYNELICPLNKYTGDKSAAVKNWSKTHISAWLLWVPNLTSGSNKCNRDEWPPMHFLDTSQTNYNQWIRFVPASANKGAGQLWKGTCGDPKKSTTVQGGQIVSQTCIETKSIIITLNKLTMEFTNVPGDALTDNPCLPKITDDPGFALLTNDVWYGGNANNHHTPSAYQYSPASSLTATWGSPPRTSPAKRDLQLETLEQVLREATDQGSIFAPLDLDEFEPDKVLVNVGDTSRKATAKELWQHLGIIDCGLPDCSDKIDEFDLDFDVDDATVELFVPEFLPADPTSDILPTSTAMKAGSGSKPTSVATATIASSLVAVSATVTPFARVFEA